jgi:hypothetical protein
MTPRKSPVAGVAWLGQAVLPSHPDVTPRPFCEHLESKSQWTHRINANAPVAHDRECFVQSPPMPCDTGHGKDDCARPAGMRLNPRRDSSRRHLSGFATSRLWQSEISMFGGTGERPSWWFAAQMGRILCWRVRRFHPFATDNRFDQGKATRQV